MFGVRLSKMGSASKLGLIAKAIGILRKYGTDAHVYLPGVGTISGLTAGNYLDSAGTTAATVDNPVGLSLDALQAMTLGSELAPALQSGLWISVLIGWTVAGGIATVDSSVGGATAFMHGNAVVNKSYLFTYTISAVSGTGICATIGGGSNAFRTTPGTYTDILVAGGTGGLGIKAGGSNTLATITAVSIREIPGIHASQATTSNKCLLRLTNGKYNWVFDSTDLLTATYPAGYEAATVIDAVTSGVTTNQGVNVVGSYSIGPSVNTAGRILMRTAPTAAELLTLQRWAGTWI